MQASYVFNPESSLVPVSGQGVHAETPQVQLAFCEVLRAPHYHHT